MNFTKMHGCQNDFVFINCMNEDLSQFDLNDLARRLCDRRLGVGADGLILVRPSDKADAFMQIFNADGSEDTMCGNGIRCTAKYVYDHNIIPAERSHTSIDTADGVKEIDLTINNGKVEIARVNMGIPRITSKLPEAINVNGLDLKFYGIDDGTDHAVYFIEDNPAINGINSWADSDFAKLGVYFETHERFPNRTSSDFIEIISRGEINMRVFERGCGETMACGTGATASVFAGVLSGKLDNNVLVHLRGGDLRIEVDGGKCCYLIGPAVEVFAGEF